MEPNFLAWIMCFDDTNSHFSCNVCRGRNYLPLKTLYLIEFSSNFQISFEFSPFELTPTSIGSWQTWKAMKCIYLLYLSRMFSYLHLCWVFTDLFVLANFYCYFLNLNTDTDFSISTSYSSSSAQKSGQIRHFWCLPKVSVWGTTC